MINPLDSVRYINLADKLNTTLTLINNYLDLKIKVLKEDTKNTSDKNYLFTIYVDDKAYKQKVPIKNLDEEIVKIVQEYMGTPVKICWILESKGD